MTAAKTHWDKPAHLIVSERCRFGMTDVVNGYIISTVGDYRPREDGPAEPIGFWRLYETMVFLDSGRRCEIQDCPCGGLPEPEEWTDLECRGYISRVDAARGHRALVERWGKR